MSPQGDPTEDDSPLFPRARRDPGESRFVLQLFALSAGLLTAAALLAAVLTWITSPPQLPPNSTFVVPAAFVFSTALLLGTSAALQKALGAVRRERQRSFRRALFWALGCGASFVGVQTFGLCRIVLALATQRNAGEAQLGATSLVLGAAALHAMHVCVALMVLVYVTLRGLHDRYDHEYSFGVAVCAWFWHILGFLWIFILGAYAVVAVFLTSRVSTGS